VYCKSCGKKLGFLANQGSDENPLCFDCANKSNICTQCGKSLSVFNQVEYEGRKYCQSCFDQLPKASELTAFEEAPENEPGLTPAPSPEPQAGQSPSDGEPKKKRRGIWAVLAGIGVVLLKFKSIIIALKFGKLAGTAISMFIMIWAYSVQYGWLYAAGFVLLIAVHESGHVLAARRAGLNVSMPIFIPFFGAFISMKQQPTNARTEAIIAAGGPVVGSIGAFVCLAFGVLYNNNLLLALAYTGCLINLFNLVPVHPLDGGRIVSAISPWLWLVGIPVLVIVAIKFPNPIVILFVILGAFQAFRTWRSPNKQYFAVSAGTRMAFAALYFGLMIVLGSVMVWIHGLHASGAVIE
jgi:Zn-dependent protease